MIVVILANSSQLKEKDNGHQWHQGNKQATYRLDRQQKAAIGNQVTCCLYCTYLCPYRKVKPDRCSSKGEGSSFLTITDNVLNISGKP